MGKYTLGWLIAGTLLELIGGCRSTGSGCLSGEGTRRAPTTYAAPAGNPVSPPSSLPDSGSPAAPLSYLPPSGSSRFMEGSGSR